MCLAMVSPTIRKIKFGYKVMKKVKGGYKGEYFTDSPEGFYCPNTLYRRKIYHSTFRKIMSGSGVRYPKGFHVYENVPSDFLIYGSRRIVKVKLGKILASGSDRGVSTVISTSIKIISVIDSLGREQKLK